MNTCIHAYMNTCMHAYIHIHNKIVTRNMESPGVMEIVNCNLQMMYITEAICRLWFYLDVNTLKHATVWLINMFKLHRIMNVNSRTVTTAAATIPMILLYHLIDRCSVNSIPINLSKNASTNQRIENYLLNFNHFHRSNFSTNVQKLNIEIRHLNFSNWHFMFWDARQISLLVA